MYKHMIQQTEYDLSKWDDMTNMFADQNCSVKNVVVPTGSVQNKGDALCMFDTDSVCVKSNQTICCTHVKYHDSQHLSHPLKDHCQDHESKV